MSVQFVAVDKSIEVEGKIFPAFEIPEDRLQCLAASASTAHLDHEPNWNEKASPQLAMLANMMENAENENG